MMSVRDHLFLFTLCVLSTCGYLHATSQTLFSPEDKPGTHLVTMINNARKRVLAAVYMLTDKHIATAMVHAKNKRHVDVQLVTDASCLDTRGNQIQFLKNNHVDTFLFPSTKTSAGRTSNIMHHKFALIDDKVWTGSYNWTWSANYRNQENVIITDDVSAVSRFEKQFDRLKDRCGPSIRFPKRKSLGMKESVDYLVKKARRYGRKK